MQSRSRFSFEILGMGEFCLQLGILGIEFLLFVFKQLKDVVV